MIIDCETCQERDTGACEGCVVTFLLSRSPGDAVVVDVAEARALRHLSEAGLVPALRHRA